MCANASAVRCARADAREPYSSTTSPEPSATSRASSSAAALILSKKKTSVSANADRVPGVRLRLGNGRKVGSHEAQAGQVNEKR